ERARSIVTRNQSPDIPFSASINPYRGCEHGCIYCYARPSHAYLDLSPGLDFETKLSAKDNAPDVLVQTLRKKSYRPETLTIGANTDPYQPVERERRITRRLLETTLESRHPVAVITKSALVLRDLDLLAELAKLELVQVFLSITTLDSRLSRIMEPRAASPARRLEAVRQLSAAGVPVGVMAAPMIPAINDHELDKIVEAAATAGARTCSYILVRLPLEIKELFEAWLDEHFADRKEKVLGLIRQTRGGKLYDSSFGVRMRGQGTYADLLARRFEVARRRHGLEERLPALSADRFEPPGAVGDQLSLL
ncbi:MAG: PA0069 family radical SAM protein, partial [Deltaproteobacteria bacterium]|nr:PA0069 family radical SAM protein [Deltaproteobacteria bacterium]